MNITELENYSLDDAIVFHDTLNPALYTNNKMRPEVRSHLLKIATHFAETMDIADIDIVDITVSGSNAAYTYTPHSDIDLHLIVAMPDLNNELFREYFNLKKFKYNMEHNITIRKFDIEVYVQIEGDPHASAGIYSVLNNKWIAIPKKVKATIDDASVSEKVDNLSTDADLAIKQNDKEAIDAVKERIYSMRRAGLEKGGEFSPENIAFKILRTHGVIEKLRDASDGDEDIELSLEQQQMAEANKIKDEWNNGITEDITASELTTVERIINQVWNNLGVNIKLLPRNSVGHFLDRVNDKRNKKDITVDELTALFIDTYKKYGLDITKLNSQVEVVIKGLASQLNVPVVITPSAKGYETNIAAKTIMRKKNFGTSNAVLTVENQGNK